MELAERKEFLDALKSIAEGFVEQIKIVRQAHKLDEKKLEEMTVEEVSEKIIAKVENDRKIAAAEQLALTKRPDLFLSQERQKEIIDNAEKAFQDKKEESTSVEPMTADETAVNEVPVTAENTNPVEAGSPAVDLQAEGLPTEAAYPEQSSDDATVATE